MCSPLISLQQPPVTFMFLGTYKSPYRKDVFILLAAPVTVISTWVKYGFLFSLNFVFFLNN